jgi:mRNA interferase HicA
MRITWGARALIRGTNPLACVHVYVYTYAMKRRELERRLRELGWTLQRHGGKHDVWINAEGSFTEYVPRHPEINERLAQVILRRAKERQ